MKYKELKKKLDNDGVTLVAVSKTKPQSAIQELYTEGQRIFGENRVQEMAQKAEDLPDDIEWHMIGQLQKNKVKYIAGFVSMIHSCDSLALAKVINKQAEKHNRKITVLIQIKVATEEAKSGWSYEALGQDIEELKGLANLELGGIMGMGSFTSDHEVTKLEFNQLRSYFEDLKLQHFKDYPKFKELSMGMSGDYPIAIEHGSTMVRIGSLLFGGR